MKNSLLKMLPLVVVSVLLAACTSGGLPPGSLYEPVDPAMARRAITPENQDVEVVYRRLPGVGKWPMIRNAGRGFAYKHEDGKMAWYGAELAGNTTANGETFDPGQMTAAHRTYPFNSIVRVYRVDTGKSIEVRINDRGPFVQGRVIDLSRRAAEKLDLIEDGIAPCRVEVLEYPAVEPGGPRARR